uniref:Ig-like domain-containing protein n=1 Tax=Canis lupus familiaris TaxID=9615 RepID=A0A8I3MRY1_CANLF
MILETRDQVPRQAPCMEPASPSACTTQGNVLSVVCTAELHKPSITSNNSSPVENADSVVLMCEAQTQSTSCLWSVNSKSLPDSPRLELSLDNRTLTVHGVTRNDTGPYECETRNPVSADHSDPFTLNVLYSSYHQGANLSLSCRTASNPPAQYSWLINGRPQPSTQELFIPNITANDIKAITVSGKCIPGASAVSTVVRVCLPFREEPRSSFPFATKAQICP